MQQEVADLLMQPNIATARGIRDRALLELLYSSGLRREETVKIELYDLDMQAGTVKVTGKGNKQRIVPVGRFALYWIHKYIKDVRGVARDQYLFVGLQTRKKMHVESIGYIVKQCGKEAGIKKKITPHALRHACATHMMQNGAPSTMVQAFLGHEHLITTQIYTHVLTEDLHAVLDRYHPRKWMHVLGSMNPPAL
jgi:integrase/recombinase XerD